jgi:hypothetical protein
MKRKYFPSKNSLKFSVFCEEFHLKNYKFLLIFSVISACIQALVQDLENSCEPALIAMSKVNSTKLSLIFKNCVCINFVNCI